MITANNKNRDVTSEFNEFLNRRILKNLNKIKKNKTDKNKKPKKPVSANN